ncbi:MAG: type II secretion system major pseudopilin GspG [Phycisphaerae bacterium]
MRSQTAGGFTLIEVLLVLVILGLLAAMVVPNLMKVGDRAKIDLARATVGPSGPIAQALDLFKLHVGRYPTTDEGLKALVERPDGIEEDSDIWRGPYIMNPDQLKDPWRNEYQYKSPGDVNTETYDLWSNGPDGEEGTDDDIRNFKSDQEL